MKVDLQKNKQAACYNSDCRLHPRPTQLEAWRKGARGVYGVLAVHKHTCDSAVRTLRNTALCPQSRIKDHCFKTAVTNWWSALRDKTRKSLHFTHIMEMFEYISHIFFFLRIHITWPWLGGSVGLESQPKHQRDEGSIPSQGDVPGLQVCSLSPVQGMCRRQSVDVSLSLSPALPSFLLSTLF